MSASNLNYIASALEKLNISDEQIATIKSKLTDVSGYDNIQNGLGQLATVLAIARAQDKTTLNDLSNKIYFKQVKYVGNGLDDVYLNYDTDKQFVGMICASSISDYDWGQSFYVVVRDGNYFNVQGMAFASGQFKMLFNTSVQYVLAYNRVIITANTLADHNVINENGVTYNCLIFQS